MRGNQTEAEDVLGMAMLRAREAWRTSSKPIDNVKAWLVRLVNNLCTNLLKKRDRLFSCEAKEELWVSQEEEPDLAATRQDLEFFFEGEVNNLSPKLRETFFLYWKEELSYKEIAERLAISQGTARKRVSNARAILRERWNEYNGVTEDPSSSLATDVEETSADELSVGEPASSRLDEAKRNPTRVNPAELRPKEELQRPFLLLPRREQSQRPKLGSLCVSPEPGLKSKLQWSKLAWVPRPQAVGAIFANARLSLRIKNRYQFELPGRWVWCYFASGQIGRGNKRLIGKGRSVVGGTQLLFLPFWGLWVPVPSSSPTEKMALLSGKWPCRPP
jgi:RNA polymerase sigma-70 factor (ECF subfamily)